MSELLEYCAMFARLPFALRRFLRHPLTLDAARTIVRERMAHREDNFLQIVERSIYGHPPSPYRALLKAAGCEMGDVRALVSREGLDGALLALRKQGVYVTFEEFKGRKPIVRNGATIEVTARDFDNPFARRHYTMQTGGSTGIGATVQADMDYLAAMAPNTLLMLDAHGVPRVPAAVTVAMLPGAGFSFIFQRSFLRAPTHRWFTAIGWRSTKGWPKYSLATLYMLFWGNAFGGRLPMPRPLKPAQAGRIAHWMHDTLKTHGQCMLIGGASLALRACIYAEQTGWDFTGATIRTGGEPLTPAKAAVIQRTGARVFTSYGMIEATNVALGCARTEVADDGHLSRDAYALITYPFLVESIGITVPAFNLTTLLDTAPKVMLNLQTDDYGIVEERSCGCPLEAYGYSTHVSEVRSYSKLLGESVTLIGNELIRIVEEVLPARFGGTPLDYQLSEEEDAQGFTRVFLIVHPRVTIADEQQVVDVVLAAMRESSPTADVARALWKQAQTIRIRRAEPRLTARGKFLPLHIQRRS